MNICGALGSRFSGDVQGTANEPFHQKLRRFFKAAGGRRKMELLEILQAWAMLIYNGAYYINIDCPWVLMITGGRHAHCPSGLNYPHHAPWL